MTLTWQWLWCASAMMVLSLNGIAFVGATTVGSSPFVNIVGLPGGMTQSLPTSYVQSFPRWIIQEQGRLVSRPCSFAQTSCTTLEWDSDLSSKDGGLLRNPWQIRPTLDVLIKSGLPSYVMAGMQLRRFYATKASKTTIITMMDNGNQMDEEQQQEQPNDEMERQCPLARQWTTFSFAVEPSFRVETFVTTHGTKEGQSSHHESLLDMQQQQPSLPVSTRNPAEQMRSAMEIFGIFLSQIGQESPLSSGFHIVSIPLQQDWMSLPPPDKGPYTLTCLATAEPDAKELLDLDTGLVEMTASSVLEMQVIPPSIITS